MTEIGTGGVPVPQRQPLVVANWKMNGLSASIDALLSALLAEGSALAGPVQWAICPPFPYLCRLAERLGDSTVLLGAQDVCEQAVGAYTGEVSAAMLVDCGCQMVIVGHSECRRDNGDSDVRVAHKFVVAREHGLTPILCVGETLAQREAGRTQEIVAAQLDAVAVGDWGMPAPAIAYEPVWAIGTGNTATLEQVQQMHAFIRQWLRQRVAAEVAAGVRILYGGSVRPDNAGALFALPDVDGGLIGGASLQAADFLRICAAAG